MLKHLSIKNYALINSLETEFFPGFSVLTGETGAGKSIILGALSLILGHRADLQSLKSKTEKCVVEGVFLTKGVVVESFFHDNNLDFDPEITILRREILPSGKSRAFINDTPVGLSVLKELAGKLVDLHSQNSSLLLQSPVFQLSVIDSFCENGKNLTAYKELFSNYNSKLHALENLKEQEAKAAAEQDYLKFQFEELDKAKLVDGEKEELEQELEVLNHAEEIKTSLSHAIQILEGEQGLNEIFSGLLSEMKSVKDFSKELEEVFNRLESSYLDISDLNGDLEKINERVEVNPQRAIEVNERLNIIYHLEQKHRASGIEQLKMIKADYHEKISAFESLKDNIFEAEQATTKMEKELWDLAEKLSASRHTSKQKLESKISRVVKELGMPDATVKLNIEKSKKLTSAGFDQVTFLFNANKGMQLKEMSKIASGGELSRLMLAIKSQIAATNLVSTIIFDEIDSGVSGEIAGKMAGIMQDLAEVIQVISITHLPQIAARGKNHYLVLKETDHQSTTTIIKKLHKEERITEIAKMLSDTRISSSALQTAEELINN